MKTETYGSTARGNKQSTSNGKTENPVPTLRNIPRPALVATKVTGAEVRSTKLANQNGLARRGAGRVKQLSLGRTPLAAHDLIVVGRF
jgi:hypothetical protein